MARTRSISSIDSEIHQTQEEISKLEDKLEVLQTNLLNLQKVKAEIESKQIMDAFKKSGKSLHELMVFLEG